MHVLKSPVYLSKKDKFRGFHKMAMNISQNKPLNEGFKKKRSYTPRKSYSPRNQPERELVNLIVDTLRSNNCYAGIIKTKGSYLQGRYLKDKRLFCGVPDIFVFNIIAKKAWFVECKVGYNKLDAGKDEWDIYNQVNFKLWCDQCGVGHIVAYEIDDIKKIFNVSVNEEQLIKPNNI